MNASPQFRNFLYLVSNNGLQGLALDGGDVDPFQSSEEKRKRGVSLESKVFLTANADRRPLASHWLTKGGGRRRREEGPLASSPGQGLASYNQIRD